MVFGNEEFTVPDGLESGQFLIRPLRTTDVKLDYDAVMETREFLRKWEQSTWPEDDFTLEDNFKDLDRHEKEHINRESFTFTVMNPDETECLGCIYIFPLTARWLSEAETTSVGETKWEDYEAVVLFWIRQSRLAEGMEQMLLETLRPWFEQAWSFNGLLYMTNALLDQQIALFEQAGMAPQVEAKLPKDDAKYLAYA